MLPPCRVGVPFLLPMEARHRVHGRSKGQACYRLLMWLLLRVPGPNHAPSPRCRSLRCNHPIDALVHASCVTRLSCVVPALLVEFGGCGNTDVVPVCAERCRTQRRDASTCLEDVAGVTLQVVNRHVTRPTKQSPASQAPPRRYVCQSSRWPLCSVATLPAFNGVQRCSCDRLVAACPSSARPPVTRLLQQRARGEVSAPCVTTTSSLELLAKQYGADGRESATEHDARRRTSSSPVSAQKCASCNDRIMPRCRASS
jgi:hypothetical protein